MAHVDGHCATPGETIYVQKITGTCVDSNASDLLAGTAGQPLCSMVPVPLLLAPNRNLVVVRGTVTCGTSTSGSWMFMGQGGATSLSIVGQQSAVIAASDAPALSLQTGSAYMRAVKVSSSAGICISATGGTLTLDTVTIDSCQGGGLLVAGAAFDIRNTSITKNGPSSDLVWGGMRVASLAASGAKNLHLVTIQNNNAPGLSCATGAAIQGDGVFATGNSTGDVTPSCGLTACMPMSSTCGAQ
jgi:hypothetical protein